MKGRGLRLVLVALITLLAGGLLWQELAGPEPLPPVPIRADDWTLPQVEEVRIPPLEHYEAMLARPLFNPDRKPVDMGEQGDVPGDKPGEVVEKEPPQPLEIVLRGVILLPEHKIALLEDSKGTQHMRVREGDPLKGDFSQWTLVELNARSAKFRQEGTGHEEELRLQVYGKPLPAAAQTVQADKNGKGGKRGNPPGKKQTGKSGSGLDPDEIRRKVAERRARMRAEAARKRAQQKSKREH